MNKRDLFAELTEGLDALGAERRGKVILHRRRIKLAPVPALSAEEIVVLRDRLHLSRGVFARCLRTNTRTLENWGQGRARPNAQVVLLMRLVDLYPDTIARLVSI